jgi:putative ABC transport system permease protein
MFRATLKTLLAHRLRLGLTACAVALGVAFMAGTFILTTTIGHGVDDLFAAAASGTDVIVRPVVAASTSGSPTVPASLLGRVRSVAGVALADGAVKDRAGIVGKDGKILGGRVGLGVSWPADPALATGYPLRQGRPPPDPARSRSTRPPRSASTSGSATASAWWSMARHGPSPSAPSSGSAGRTVRGRSV